MVGWNIEWIMFSGYIFQYFSGYTLVLYSNYKPHQQKHSLHLEACSILATKTAKTHQPLLGVWVQQGSESSYPDLYPSVLPKTHNNPYLETLK